MNDKWIKVNVTRLPKPLKDILAFGLNSHGKGRIMKAIFVPSFTLEFEYGVDEGDYDECPLTENLYWVQGWYECNECDETLWIINFDITHWMYLPDAP